MKRTKLLVVISALLVLAAAIFALAHSAWRRHDSLFVHKAAAQGDTVLLASALARYPEQLDLMRSFELDKRLSTLSPLMWAARNGQYETAKLLIDRGANINATDRFNRTALLLAVRERHIHIVDLLLEASADLDSITTSGSSPLIFAVRQGDIVLTSKLLDAGADPNVDGLGRTPLFTAVNEGHYEVFRLLVSRGAKLRSDSDRTKMLSIMEGLPPEKAKLIEELLLNSSL